VFPSFHPWGQGCLRGGHCQDLAITNTIHSTISGFHWFQALYITTLINCNIYTLVRDVYLAGRELCNELWIEKGVEP
jgi:hypothetical protein